MHAVTHSLPGRALALALATLLATLGCVPGDTLDAAGGVPEYQQLGLVPVPGGTVNAAGGNLLVERLDMSIDTVMGTWELRAVYNSTSGDWLWSFQITYDGETFVDPTGAAHDVTALPDGSPIPGTVWIKASADTIETKGGLGYHFDAQGRPEHVAWRSGAYPRIEYAWTAGGVELIACTQAPACLPFYTIDLNAAGDPVLVTDARTGRQADFAYDASGRLVTARSPLEVDEDWLGTRYEYNPGTTLLHSITSSENERIEYAWQAGRRMRQVTQIGEGNPNHRFRFLAKDGDGLYPTLHTNPLGGETRYRFDTKRRLHEVTLEDTGEVFTYEWTGKRVAGAKLPNGVTTAFTYVQDDVATITQPSGNVVTITYEPDAVNIEDTFRTATRRVEDSIGLVEERTYDPEGRVETLTNGEGEVTSVTYFVGQTVESLTNAAGLTWSFPLYGIHGHWLEVEGATEDQRAFDPAGNATATSVGRQTGGVLTQGFDHNRNLVSIEVAGTDSGDVTSTDTVTIERRSDGQLLAVNRPGGANHAFSYDGLGRLSERRELTDGVWHATSFEYDPAGDLTARSRPNGMREVYDRDRYGRLLRRAAYRDSVFEGEVISDLVLGEVRSVYDSIRDGTEFNTFDEAGRLTSVLYPDGESVRFEYDLRSRQIAEEYVLPDQTVVRRIEYEYDLANRQVRVTTDGEEVLIERVFTDGFRSEELFGNGLTRSYAYDPTAGQLSSTETIDSLGASVEATTVSRAPALDPPRFAIVAETETPLGATLEDYALGAGGSFATPSLRVGKRVWGWTDGVGDRQYVYDELSNMLSNGAGDTFSYNDEGNRLLSATLAQGGQSISFTYDAAGFATSRNGVAIAWTATGRISGYGSAVVEWDMRDRIVSVSSAAGAREFTYFGGRIENDPATGALVALDLGDVVLPFGSEERRYRHLDWRGNVSFVTDESGAVVAHYGYSPYGVALVFGEPSDPVRFVGRPGLEDLMLLGARVYDPLVGRFLSPDPVFQLLNQYAYTAGNPLWYWDPDGASATSIALKTAILAGAVLVAASLFVPASATVVVAGTSIAVADSLAKVGAIILIGAAAADLGLDIFRNDPCDSQCAFPPFEDGSTATALSSLLQEGAGNREGGLNAGGIGSLAAPVPVGCAPSALAALPETGWALYLLIPLQLLLAGLVLRQRVRHRGRRYDD